MAKPGLKKGQTNNPNGRPKNQQRTIAEKFRNDPRCWKVLEKIYSCAVTLNTKEEHKDALQCAKIVADKAVPNLKSQEIEMNPEMLRNIGIIVLPSKKAVGAPVETKKDNKIDT